MSEPTRRWKDALSDEPVNEARARIYERLMGAQERIAQARNERGVDHTVIQAALDQSDERLCDDDRREDLYVSALAHYVQALGGRLEVRAVFEDDTILVRCEPDDNSRVTDAA